MVKHRLVARGWDLRWGQSKTKAAHCALDDKEIVLSEPVLTMNPWHIVQDAVLHEIAHALVDKPDHDDDWRMKFIELGGSGCRILHCLVPPGRWTLRCEECGASYQRYTTKPPTRREEGSCRAKLECRHCFIARRKVVKLKVIETGTGQEVMT